MELENMFGKSEEEYAQIPGIPEHITGALYRYVEHGIGPGSFLSAVLCNDFKQAVHCADEMNLMCLVQWVHVMTWCVPGSCQGSPELVDEWMANKRIEKEEG